MSSKCESETPLWQYLSSFKKKRNSGQRMGHETSYPGGERFVLERRSRKTGYLESSQESESDPDWAPQPEDWNPQLTMGDGGKEKSRKKTSSVWRYCEIIDEAFARCTICGHKLSYKSSVTNLRKHFKKKHPEVAMPANVQYAPRNGVITLNSDEEDEREEGQRATNSVIVDYLRPAGEEKSRPKPSITYVRQSTPVIKRDRSPIRYHDYPKLETKCKKPEVAEETEFDVFGRSVVLQLKQLPLVHALELQAEIMNLIVQKRIQALRQTHETSTDDAPMQFALVYTESHETPEALKNSEVVKEAEGNQSYVKL